MMSAKIERIQVTYHQLPLDPPFLPSWDTRPRRKFPATVVRIQDADGRWGVGSGDAMYGFDDFKHLFIGQPADLLERHNAVLHNVGFHAGRCFPLEIALWDLVGRQRGVPCWVMAGGGRRELGVYASSGTLRTPEETAEKFEGYLEAGFPAAKLRFGRADIEDDLRTVRHVAAKVGDRLKIMVDCNQGWRMPWDVKSPWDLERAWRVARELVDAGVYWMEEPLHRGAVEDMAALRRRLSGSLLIAGGELTREPYEFDRLLANDSLDVYQPDVTMTMGMHGLMDLGARVVARGRSFSPHTWGNGLGLVANAHVAAGVNPPEAQVYLEFPHDPPDWTISRRDFLLSEPVTVNGRGRLVLGDSPGLGLELDEDVLRSTLCASQTYA